ncbi:5-hydroxytryptamine receptor 1A-like [Babylonia areolata]|uniref:5-hydroxytryptamine receptor 1A-like n=1 Tax=Babylonia areolata TaxID=304850 RepID=UPI003FD2B8E9
MSGVTAAAVAALVLAVSSASEGGVEGGGGAGGGAGGGSVYENVDLANVTLAVPGVTGVVVVGEDATFPQLTGNSSANLSSGTTAALPPQRPEPPYPTWGQVVVAVILGVLILCTIIGNSLVCLSVGLVKRLQTPSNLLIVSLAVADLLVALLVMPLGVTLQINGAWVLGPNVCDFWTTTDVLLCTASILNLCIISVDRYLVITRPFQYAMKRTPKRMAAMITAVWLVSAIVSIPPVFGWKSPHQPFDCVISQAIGYQIYATFCAFYLPLFVMIFVYVKIWLVSSKIAKAESRSKVGSFDKGDQAHHVGRPSRDSNESQILPNGSMLGVAKSQQHNGDGNGGGGGDGDDASLENMNMNLNTHRASDNSDRLKKRRFTIRSLIPRPVRLSSSKERKATKTLGIIMGCFTLCWLPFFILALVKTFCADSCHVPMTLDSILLWLGYANSFLNPVIYARFNREFRTPFKEILLLRCRGINTRMRSESYVEQYGGADPRHSLRPPMDCVVRLQWPTIASSSDTDPGFSLFQVSH